MDCGIRECENGRLRERVDGVLGLRGGGMRNC